ncbi:MAG: hypothetical protein AAGF47_04400 [Planctomycetota bacterium]
MSADPAQHGIIEGRYDPNVARVFRLIARRMLRKKFHAARITPGSLERLDAAANHDGPVVVCMTHAGWWDPMIGLLLHIERFDQKLRRAGGPARAGIAPIDRAVLANVGIFKKLGLFGIDPDDPASKGALVEFAVGTMRDQHLPTLWITPQGRFQDPRDAMEIRPGVSAILSRLENPQVLILASEYPFWDDQKPEMLAHITEIERPERTTTAGWHRAVASAMPAAANKLAALAITRNAANFETLLGDSGGMTFPLYDVYLRLTGRSTDAIRTRTKESLQ